MSKWVQFTGSDEQIADIRKAKNGFILRYRKGEETEVIRSVGSSFIGDAIDSRRRMLSGDNIVEVLNRNSTTHYWLIPDDPLREMKIRQAMTGQPVWIKMKSSTYWVIAMRGFDLIYQDHVVSVIKSTTPDWNIPNAEYSFIEFEKSVDK